MDQPNLPSLGRLLGSDSVLATSGTRIPVANLEKKDYIMLYFSASWCPPCRAFTPALATFYNNFADKKNFEILFCSWDNDPAQFSQYFAKMPWLALQNRPHIDFLSKKYGINSIPALVVIDAKTQEVITDQARMAVVRDPNAEKFPWKGMDYGLVPFSKNALLGVVGLLGLILFFAFRN